MHLVLTAFLIFFSGWTLTSHLGSLLGYGLNVGLLIFPILLFALSAFYLRLRENRYAMSDGSSAMHGVARPKIPTYMLGALVAIPVILHLSWNAFWVSSLLLLAICLYRKNEGVSGEYRVDASRVSRVDYLIVTLTVLAMVALSLAISRSDLDDSYYAAVAAFSSSHPAQAFTLGEPMLGEATLPLVFPSYRFASFEVLSGAAGHLFSVPAIDFYYIFFLPLWMTVSVLANFLLAKEITPKHWVLTGCLAIALILLLGEMHRSPANFSFGRIFQGKAVFLSALVPAIFYLTARYCSGRGTKADLFLLGCCQVSSIGLTNFGMLMGPVVGFTALMSNILLVRNGNSRKFLYALGVLLIPLPYLINVALTAKGYFTEVAETDPASGVWLSVFGKHQQYLVGFLLLAGPVLAKDTITRWRLAVPALLLFAVYLNPFLSDFISRHITTPLVYWRVVWALPILIFAGIALGMIVAELFEQRLSLLVRLPLFLIVVLLGIYSLPFNTLRKENIGEITSFAKWKLSADELAVVKATMSLSDEGRVLAPDEIAGIISRFENHSRLISTRRMYLDMERLAFGEAEYASRYALNGFVTNNAPQDLAKVRVALHELDVSVVVLKDSMESQDRRDLLLAEQYKLLNVVSGYHIWARNPRERQ